MWHTVRASYFLQQACHHLWTGSHLISLSKDFSADNQGRRGEEGRVTDAAAHTSTAQSRGAPPPLPHP